MVRSDDEAPTIPAPFPEPGGFADPGARMSFGYTTNRQGMSTGLDARAQSLIDAVYTALGYRRSPRGGSWYPGSR